MIGLPITWRLRTLAFAALALAVFGAIDCPPFNLRCIINPLDRKKGLIQGGIQSWEVKPLKV